MIGILRRRSVGGHRPADSERLEVRAEVLFVLLPLLVLALDHAFQQHSIAGLLTDAEFSFAASVLFGQAITKYVRGVGRTGVDGARVAYGAVKMIVFGLMPSLYTMSWMVDYHANERTYESGAYVGTSVFGRHIPLPIVGPALAQLVLCAAGVYVLLRVSAHGGPAGGDGGRGDDAAFLPSSRAESDAVPASPGDGP